MATEGATRRREPKPALVVLFERIAAVMDLDEGLTRLELEFDGGSLRRWAAHDERNGAQALGLFDSRLPVSAADTLASFGRSPD